MLWGLEHPETQPNPSQEVWNEAWEAYEDPEEYGDPNEDSLSQNNEDKPAASQEKSQSDRSELSKNPDPDKSGNVQYSSSQDQDQSEGQQLPQSEYTHTLQVWWNRTYSESPSRSHCSLSLPHSAAMSRSQQSRLEVVRKWTAWPVPPPFACTPRTKESVPLGVPHRLEAS